MNESLPIFLDNAVSSVPSRQILFSHSTQLGGGVAAIAIATAAIGKDNSTYSPKISISILSDINFQFFSYFRVCRPLTFPIVII